MCNLLMAGVFKRLALVMCTTDDMNIYHNISVCVMIRYKIIFYILILFK